MLEEAFYLGGGDAGERDVRELVLAEEPYPVGVRHSRQGLVQDLAQKTSL